MKFIHYENKTKYLIILTCLIIFIYFNWTCRPPIPENRAKNPYEGLTRNGLFIVDNFLPFSEHLKYKKQFVKKYTSNSINIDINDTFMGSPKFVSYMSKTTGYDLKPVERQKGIVSWLRYYSENVWNPFENWHLDMKRHRCNDRQFRAVYCIACDADAYFSAQTDDGIINIKTKENSLIIIEAENLLHKVVFKGGERLMMMTDFATSDKRGIHGSLVYLWDFVWWYIQKLYIKI